MGLRPRLHRMPPPTAPHPQGKKGRPPGGAPKTSWSREAASQGKGGSTNPVPTPLPPQPPGHRVGGELTAAGPGQIPGAADVHEGARQPIRPAGIVIKGPVAEQAWCSGTMASESQPGWGTSPQVPHQGGCPAETCARLTSTEASYPPSMFPPSRCHLSAVGLAAKYLRSLFSHLENGVDPQPTGLSGDK